MAAIAKDHLTNAKQTQSNCVIKNASHPVCLFRKNIYLALTNVYMPSKSQTINR